MINTTSTQVCPIEISHEQIIKLQNYKPTSDVIEWRLTAKSCQSNINLSIQRKTTATITNINRSYNVHYVAPKYLPYPDDKTNHDV